jgi:starch-binding outer membrane protein SusE/F
MISMKRLFLILTVFAGISLMYSCEKEQKNPVLDLTSVTPAVLESPQAGADLVLLQEEIDEIVLRMSWSAADYVIDNVSSPSYAIEADAKGNNFANPATIATIDSLSYAVTVGRLNEVMGVLGLTPEEKAEVDIRVRSFIPGASENLFRYSNPVTLFATPFKFVVRPIYLLGNGTNAGWSNTAALEMEHVEAATYAIVTTLKGGSGNFFKFISVRGQWAPQWGMPVGDIPTVANGVISGNLSYRPTETITDPPAIPVPLAAGTYRITADTIGLKYTVEPVTEKVFVTGNAVG